MTLSTYDVLSIFVVFLIAHLVSSFICEGVRGFVYVSWRRMTRESRQREFSEMYEARVLKQEEHRLRLEEARRRRVTPSS